MTGNPLGVNHVLGLNETGGPLEPWLVRGAIGKIERHLGRLAGRAAALEFGSGSGSYWLCQRCQSVVSVEHNRQWADRVTELLAGVRLAERHRMVVAALGPEYERAVAQIEPESLDLVLVDGRRRVRCVKSSAGLVRAGGLLVLDNSERHYYGAAHELLAGWPAESFRNSLWQTTVWRRPG